MTEVGHVVARGGGRPGRVGDEGQASRAGGRTSPQDPRFSFKLCRHRNGILSTQPKSKTYINQDQNESTLIYIRSYTGFQSWGLLSAKNALC